MSYCVKITSLAYGNHRVPVMWKVNSKKKSDTSHWEPSLFKARYCYNNLLSNFRPIICQVVAYENKSKFQIVSLKIIPVVYERWSLTKGSLRRGDRLREVSSYLGQFAAKTFETWHATHGSSGIPPALKMYVLRSLTLGRSLGFLNIWPNVLRSSYYLITNR